MKLFIVLCSFVIWNYSHGAFFKTKNPLPEYYYYRFVSPPPNTTEGKANFSQLDIRVGKIVDIWNHTTNNRLYVMKVDFGGGLPLRTVVEGLRPYVLMSELKDQLKIFLYNLNPFVISNTTNEALILCANDGRVIEPLWPPNGSVPGDVAYVTGYEYKPVSVINQKIFDEAMFDLFTDHARRATYLSIPWDIGGKGCAMVKVADSSTIR